MKIYASIEFSKFFIVFYKIFIFHTNILHKNLDHPQISYSNKNLHKLLTTLTLCSLKLQGAWGRFCLTMVSLRLECTMYIRVMIYLNLKYDWSHWYALIFRSKLFSLQKIVKKCHRTNLICVTKLFFLYMYSFGKWIVHLLH